MAQNLSSKLQEQISSIIKKENYLTHNIVTRRINADGSGFMGVLYSIDIQGKTENGDKEINIFVKNIIPNPEDMKIYSVKDIYTRETFAYKELSKILTKLQDDAMIPEEKRFKMAKSYDECNPEAIILENLTVRGFKTYNRMDVVSLEFAELSIKQLAKFHALSFVLKETQPKFFEENIQCLQQPFNFGEEWHGFIRNMFKFSMNFLEKGVRDRFEDKIWEIVNKYPAYMNEPTFVATFCHGDYRHGNIMARERDNKPTEVIPVDFQLLHYGSPLLDLIYFIFNGTDQEFRNKHLASLKNLYYDTMKEFLKNFNILINSVWTKHEFERIFEVKLDFGLMINVFYMPFTFAAEDDIPDVTGALSEMDYKVDPRFSPRFRGVVEDFINWGYL